MDKYTLKRSVEDSRRFILTDTEVGLVCTFTEGQFNDTQEFSYLGDIDPLAAAKAVNEMTEWLANNYWAVACGPRQEEIRQRKIRDAVRKRVGDIIKARREELGFSSRDLALRSGVGYGHIARIERGKYNVSIDTLALLCVSLGLDFDLRVED